MSSELRAGRVRKLLADLSPTKKPVAEAEDDLLVDLLDDDEAANQLLKKKKQKKLEEELDAQTDEPADVNAEY